MRGGVIVIVAAALLLAACGSSSRLSAGAYRTQLAKVKQEAARAQAQVQQGLRAKTIAELRSRLDAFAAASQRIGDEVSKLKPPKNAESANAELAQGEYDTAKATRAASAAVAKAKTVKAAFVELTQHLSNDKGALELDLSLKKLKALGYTSGS